MRVTGDDFEGREIPRMDLLTYTEAAELTGLANKTIQRHVKKGLLAVVETPVGKRIPRSALAPYLGLKRDSGGQGQGHPAEEAEERFETSESPPEEQAGPETPRQGQTWSPEGLSVPLSAHMAALDLARTQMESLQRIVDESQRQLEESHRVALSAERAKLSLEVQLGQYQRVLAEQAESLAEERARRLAAESKIQEPPVAPVPEVELKVATPVRAQGWGQRLRGWLLGTKTG